MRNMPWGEHGIGESQFAAATGGKAAASDGGAAVRSQSFFGPDSLPADFAGSVPVVDAADAASITLDSEMLLKGDYSRVGDDLTVTAPDGSSVVLGAYFDNLQLPVLVSPDGAMLLGHTVSLLAGPPSPGQYAQTSITPQNPIGEVALLEGGGSVQHADGTSIELVKGAPIFEDDVISTGDSAKLSLKFIDGTALTMSANARMVMDEMVYDPARTDNSMVLNLVQGSFVFVTGLVAKTGTVRADTPVATMGIRGTTPTVTVESVTKTTTFGIAPDPDGRVGSYQILNLTTGQVLGIVSSTSFLYRLASANGTLQQLVNDPLSQGDPALLQDTYDTFGQPGDPNNGQNQNEQNQENPEQDGQNEQGPEFGNPEIDFANLEIEGLGENAQIEPLIGELNPLNDEPQGPPPGFEGIGELPPPDGNVPDFGNPEQGGPTILFSLGGSFSLAEDSGATLGGFSIIYPGLLTVSVAAGSTVTLASTDGLTFASGDGTGDETMTFTGPAAAIQNAFNGAIYTPTPDSNHGTLEIVFADAVTGQQVGSITVPITIAPVEDVPIASNDLFIDIAEDAGRAETPLFEANLFADNGNGEDYDPDDYLAGSPSSQEPAVATFTVTRVRVDENDDGSFEDETWVNVDAQNDFIHYGNGEEDPDGGYVSVSADGSITILPGTDWDFVAAGVSQKIGALQYEITSDFDENTALATVTAFVTGQNDAPIANAFSFSDLTETAITEDGPVTIVIQPQIGEVEGEAFGSQIIDPDNDDVLQVSLTQPLKGSVAVAAGGSGGFAFTFDPNGEFDGLKSSESETVSFEYTVTDEAGASDKAIASIVVYGRNDAPTLTNPMADQLLAVNATVDFELPQGMFSDVDGETLTVVAKLANGDDLPAWLVFDGQSFTGTPPAGFAGTFQIAVTASDGNLSASDQFKLEFGNHNFEAGDFSQWSVFGAAFDDTLVVQSIAAGGGGLPIALPANEGSYFAAIGSGATANIAGLEAFLGLEAGVLASEIAGGGVTTGGSAISIELEYLIGDTISFDWYFDSGDYSPFRDAAFFVNPDGVVHLLDAVDATTLSNNVNASDSTGWQTSSFVVTANVIGSASFGIANVSDIALESFLYVDNFRVGYNVVQGTNGDDVLHGTLANDLYLPLDGTPEGDDIFGSTGNDRIDFAGAVDGFYDVLYYNLPQGTAFTIELGETGGTIQKGALGTDTLVYPGGFDDDTGGLWIATAIEGDDSVSVNPEKIGFLGLDLIGGNDNVERVGTSGTLQLFFRHYDGVVIDADAGTVTEINGPDTLTITGFVNQWHASLQSDAVNGTGGDEVFITETGKDIVDGRGGHDVLRYDRDLASLVQVSYSGIGMGMVTGIWYAQQFSTEFYGIEEIRGARTGATLFEGAGGDDIFVGRGSNNWFEGNGGNDTMTASQASDILVFGENSGDDTIHNFGAGTDLIDLSGLDFDAVDDLTEFNFDGTDSVIDLGSGTIKITGVDLTTANPADVFIFNRIVGTPGDDPDLQGTGNNDMILALGGNDYLHGLAGRDVLRSGGATLDFNGYDFLYGGDGDDLLIAEGGFANLDGGQGNDILVASFRFGDAYWDWARADYAQSPAGIVANLTSGTPSVAGLAPSAIPDSMQVADGFGTVDTFVGINAIHDSSHNDYIFIDGSYSTVFGNQAFIRLGAGNDFVELTGVTGTAQISYQRAEEGVHASLATGTATENDPDSVTNLIGTDVFIGANQLRGSIYNDTLLGNAGDNRLIGSNGSDYIDGGNGFDTIGFGDSPNGIEVDLSLSEGRVINDGYGNSEIVINVEAVTGTDWDDLISGDEFANRLDGGRGVDTLHGGEGDDILIAGAGNDTLHGEGGADTFVLDKAGGLDWIAGYDPSDLISIAGLLDSSFEPGSWQDYISLSLVLEADDIVGTDVFVDVDGNGEEFDFEQVASISFDAPVSEVVLNIIFEQGGDAIPVMAVT